MTQLSLYEKNAVSLLPLRPRQETGLEELRQALRDKFLRIVFQASTGFGKTVIMAHIVASALGKGKRPLICIPRLSLINQTVERFRAQGIRDIGVIQGRHELTDYSAAVQVASVQTLVRRPIPDIDFVLYDECHLQHEAMNKILDSEAWASKIVIGFSATPWAKGMGLRWKKLIVPARTNELITEGWLTPVVGFGVPDEFVPDVSKVHTNFDGDYVEGEAEQAMTTKKIVGNVVKTWLERWGKDKTFMFCVNRSHARKMQKEFEDAGVSCGYIDGTMDAFEREQVFRKYRSGEYRILASIDTVGIGVDEDVRCIIYLRLTKSEMRWCLDSETEILTSHGWKGRSDIKVGDCAASTDDVATLRGCWSPIVDVVDRPMSDTETWIEYHAPRADFRVTDNHRMICAPRKDRTAWKIIPAGNINRGDGVSFPTAVHMNQTGIPLTDAELYFVGMMMTDGTWSTHTGEISQSERYPEVIKRIEACLGECGFWYTKRRVVPGNSNFIERFPRWIYKIPMSPRPGKKGTGKFTSKAINVPGTKGMEYLLPFLDKDFSPALMQMSKDQLLKLLQGLWDGDGLKLENRDWTPQGWSIVSVRKMMIDRLQALCSINGFTASIGKPQMDEHRYLPLWRITVTPKDWRCCGGNGDRPQIEENPSTNENVWCVQTTAGTIVTRRRGKVTVMGNCQDGGRGIRLADGKDSLLLLDHAGTAEELGLFTDIHHDSLDVRDPKEKGQAFAEDKPPAKPRKCPKCSALVSRGATACPVCGSILAKDKGPRVVQGELVEIGRKKKEPTVDEKQSFFSQALGLERERNYKEGYAANLYRKKWGVWPRGLQSVTAFPSSAVRRFAREQAMEYRKSKEQVSA